MNYTDGHSGGLSFNDADFSNIMDGANNHELPSVVHDGNADGNHTSDFMEEFDNNNEITSSPYGSHTNGTSEYSEHRLQHTLRNGGTSAHTVQTDSAAVENQEMVSATERHGSEPVPAPESKISGLALQGLSINAPTSIMAPSLNTVHRTVSDNTLTQPATSASRAARRRANTVANPQRPGAMANGNASTTVQDPENSSCVDRSLHHVGPVPIFFQHGHGNAGSGAQTGGHLADEELEEAMARGSRPIEMAPNTLVPRGYNFDVEGQNNGQASASVPKVEYNQNNFHTHYSAPGPAYGSAIGSQQQESGPPVTDFASAFDYSTTYEDPRHPHLNWYGAPRDAGIVSDNDFDFDPSDYTQYGFGPNSSPQQASPNALQVNSYYPDPEASRLPTQPVLNNMPAIPQSSGRHHTRAAPRTRGRRSVQRQLLPAGTPDNSPSASNNMQHTVLGDAPDNITLRYRDLDEANRAMNRVDNPVVDPSVPTEPEEQRAYVQRIVAAMHSTWKVNDNPSMVSMWDKQKQNAGAVELVAWRLFRRCLDAHRQLDPLIVGGRYTRFDTFEHRLAQIIEALMFEKTLCRHAMATSFLDQLIDDPVGAQHRVHNNRKVNGGKKEAIEKGRRAMDKSRSGQDSDGQNGMEVDPNMNQETADPGRNALITPLAGQTQSEIDAARARADELGRSDQEQVNNPVSKKAATKKGSGTKSGTGPTRKRKTDDDSDDAYHPTTRRTNKRQSSGAVKKEYKGKYPQRYNAELGANVITSLPSPPHSTPAPIPPAPHQDHYFSGSGQYQAPASPVTSSYRTGYHNTYQGTAAPFSCMGGATTYQGQNNAMTNATGHGHSYGAPPGGYGSNYHPSVYHTPYQDTPEAVAVWLQQRDEQRQAQARANGNSQAVNPQAVDPTLDDLNPLNPGRNPRTTAQALSQLTFPHAPGAVADEFNENEPEPEELYQFATPEERRKSQRKPPRRS